MGEQAITIRAAIPVAEIARSPSWPAVGATVVVMTVRQPDGTLRSSALFLEAAPGPPR